jgi:cytochrome c peroxidase
LLSANSTARKITFPLALISLFIISFGKKEAPVPYIFPELKFFPPMPVAADNPVTEEGALLGRYLFYDPVLSIDSSMSCASCHRPEAAFSDSPHDFSIGRNGVKMKRNTMPLFNLAWYPAFFWDGRAESIEAQVFHPVRGYDEMNLQWDVASKRLQKSKFYKPLFTRAFGKQKTDSVHITKAIAQFLRTLISYQSKYDEVISGKKYFTKDEYEGFILMNDQTKGDCIHCHLTDGDALSTNLFFSNNGLDSVNDAAQYKDKGRGVVTGNISDYGKFMVPSMRNLAFTSPYMHDGRFETLNEVLDFYASGVKSTVNIDSKMGFAHAGGNNLSEDEKRKIIAFLLTLSDSAFVLNKAFANPF